MFLLLDIILGFVVTGDGRGKKGIKGLDIQSHPVDQRILK
jgi:hypothetical protein